MRNRFKRMTCLPPGTQATDDYKRTESLFPQHERHTGARGLARSSAVDINVSILGKVFDFFGQVVGLDAHRPLDAL